MEPEHKVKVDKPEPETEPVIFVDITLNCGRVLELAVKHKQGDEYFVDGEGEDRHHYFRFPKFHLVQKVWCREVAAISIRESVIVILPPAKDKA